METSTLYIDGYTHQLSYAPGEEVEFRVSTSAAHYSLEIARLGATREVVFNQPELPGAAHPIPENASSHGCGWPTSFTLAVPETWQSGYYEGTLRATDSGGTYVYRNRRTAESKLFFIVRPAKPAADTPILLQLSTNTYNAYNNWGRLQSVWVSRTKPVAGQSRLFRQACRRHLQAVGIAFYCLGRAERLRAGLRREF